MKQTSLDLNYFCIKFTFKEKHPKTFLLLFASLQSAKPIYGL